MRYKTLSEAAQAALDVQDASNLSGVAYAFAEAVKAVREYEPNLGTNGYNTHPIVVLFVSKLSDLSRADSFTVYQDAWERCKALATPDRGVL